MNYIELFKTSVEKCKDKVALIDAVGKTITYQELDRLSDLVAGKLVSIGCNKGDAIAINMGRYNEYIASFIGVLKAACVFAPLIPDYPEDRINFILQDCDAKVVITKDFFEDIDKYTPYCNPASDKEPAALVYTSGSTGKPKSILHSAADLTRAVNRLMPIMNEFGAPRFCATAPMSFVAFAVDYFTVLALGGTTIIASDEIRKSNVKLAEFFRDNKITGAIIVPQMLKLYNNIDPDLKFVITGTERVSNIYSDEYKIKVLYGMSEEFHVTEFVIDKLYKNTPVGVACVGVKIHIKDENGNDVPDGTEGEICIEGEFDVVYANDPEKSKKTFVKTSEGTTIIHSGDIGFINEDGNLIYVNRMDWMVKINGQRVETLEIENIIKTDEDIADAIVHFFVDNDDQTYLVAYYVSKNPQDKLDQKLRNLLKKSVPPYMVPRYFVKIDAIPKNINGKVDRKSLVPPKTSDFRVDYVEPANDVEKQICEAFDNILKCGRVGSADDFFMLGGDSIKTIKLVSELNLEGLTREMILLGKTPAGIAKEYEKRTNSIEHKNTLLKEYPLTASQLGVYLECLEKPESTMYNIPLYTLLPKDIDVDKFEAAVKKVAALHPVLNAKFNVSGGKTVMQVEQKDILVSRKDIASFDDECSNFVKAFDLENGPLNRFQIWNDGFRNYFVYDIHHIIFDGTSIEVLLNQIVDCYLGEELEEEKLNIFDIALHEINLKDSDEYKAADKFFNEKFGSIDADSIPIADIISEAQEKGSGRVDFTAESNLTVSEVESFVRKHGITENTLFLSAFAYCLAKFNGLNNSLFCTVNNGRHDDRLSNSIGMFVRTLPMYFDIDDNALVDDFLHQTQDYFFNTMSHDCIDMSELVHKYGFNTTVQFVYQAEMLSGVEKGGIKLLNRTIKNNDLAGDMQLMIHKLDSTYEAVLNFNGNSYSDLLMNSFVNMYFQIVSEMLKADKLSEIELVNRDARILIDKFNETDAYYDKEATVVELFKEQVKQNPDAECVVYEDKKYTYKQVDELSDKLAKHLVCCGVKAETVTGILIPRSEYMVIASLGVLKAGGAYMPLDPSYPPERLNLMMQDTKAMMLITTQNLSSIINDEYQGERMMVSDIEGLTDEADLSLISIKPNDRFVMLYTSGTTGKPKGVIYEHANVMCLAAWMRDFFEYDLNTKRAVYASYGFDANVFDTYGVLTAGGSLHIISEDIRLDLLALQKYFNENNITDCVMTTQVGRQFALMPGTTSLKELSAAGEALTPLEPVNDFKFYNLYGPSEGTVLVTQFLVDRKYKNIPIGKAIDNVKLYIVDNQKKLLPMGATGELIIAGPHVTRGYLNRPEKTAESYSSNCYSNEKGYERLYHTGDIVRLLPDGNIQFVGRRDMQVKIRGFRIELTEVEEVIRRYAGIKDATVAAFDSENGGKFLAAYIVADEKIDDKKVKEFIKAEKPAYMVPAVIMQIDQIPLNQNQKVNKKALPVPAYKAEDFVAAQNEMQQKIFDIVSDAIGHKNFGIDTDFFEAGLTSIGAVKLNYDLAESFGVPVKTSDINANSTVRRLESFFNSNNKIEEYEIRSEYPISQTQQGIFVESFGSPNSTVYNIPVMLKINSNVDLNELKDAIIKASNAHPYIKTKLHMDENGDVKALRNDDAEVKIECTNIDNAPVIADYVKPFSMLDSELYRFNIIHSEGGNYLFMDLHHIISDGTSELVLLSDIRKALRKESLSTETYTAYELALDEEKLRKTSKYDDAKAYYDNLLAGCDTESLPPKTLDAKDKGSAEFSKVFELDTQVVSKYCKDNGITENAFFNAVFSVLLANFTHKEQALYVTIHNGRNDTRLKDSIAMLVKTIPVLANIDGSKAPKDLALELQKQLAKSMSNDLFAFAEIANAYDVKSDVMFVYQGADFGMDVLNSDIMEFSQGYSADAKAPITFEISITGGKYLAKLDYKTEIYNAEFAESFVSSFETAAANFMSAVSIKDISILSAEGKAFVDKVNDTDTEFENIPLCKLFEKVAAANEDKLAMVSNGEAVTFKELNERANKIANSLIKLGVKSEDIIGLIVNRSVNVIAAELGIMKAGAAFLPMLPDYPEDRIKYCLSDSESKLVITTDAIKAEHSEYFADSLSYKTKTLEELLKENNANNPNIEIPMDSMAYCIYTSGSTGNPKGVMIEHHNLTNFVQTYDGDIWLLRYEKVNGAALGMSSVSFDMSIAEIYPPLCSGMCFVMATEYEIHNPDALAKLIENNNVSCIVCTPTFIINMIDIPEFSKAFGNIKSLLSAAESLPASLIDKLQIYSPDIRIVNGYGPTETTVGCSAKIVDNAGKITIGGPSGNVKLYAIDRFGNILPPYASGELIICGEGVSRGYIKLSEKNKASFYTLNGLPAYHSGDIVRMDKNGEFEFFGRSDNQVKLRGFRVELDEIEKAFCSFTGVKQSKVIVRNNGKEDYLAAFFTADHQIDLGNLRTHLKSILTYYMVPAAIMQLDQMPLTTNGKIDKKALPEISIGKKHRSSKRTAKKTTEQELCDLFKQILALDEYYPDDDFFEMGGTSISASKVTMMLMSKGIEIQYQDVFDNPTPESLAELIDGKSPKTDASEQKEDSFASEYDSVLKYNSLAYAAEVSRKPLGNVFLVGATGFLGIHVLAELLQSEEGHIYCLVRKGKYNSPEERLKKLLVYYFDDISDEIFERRITIIDDDITNDNICDVVKDIKIDTIINCAAIVKHYAADDSLYRVNVHGVENLIDVAKEHDAKLIQISTTSIPGSHTDETYKINLKMYENQHFVIDDMDNKYISSKYQAECRIFSAIKEGLHAKVIRVGNLMGRFSDGEFQMNMTTNAFLNALRGFVTLGKCPIGHSTDPMSFSPIDLTAKVVVTLAGTDDKFTAFHADSRYGFDEYKIVESCNRCGLPIERIADDDYYKLYYQMLGDEKLNSRLSGLMTNDRPDIHVVETDNKFTANVLYRLGFAWPFADDAYLDRTIESIKTLGFFDYE